MGNKEIEKKVKQTINELGFEDFVFIGKTEIGPITVLEYTDSLILRGIVATMSQELASAHHDIANREKNRRANKEHDRKYMDRINQIEMKIERILSGLDIFRG